MATLFKSAEEGQGDNLQGSQLFLAIKFPQLSPGFVQVKKAILQVLVQKDLRPKAFWYPRSTKWMATDWIQLWEIFSCPFHTFKRDLPEMNWYKIRVLIYMLLPGIGSMVGSWWGGVSGGAMMVPTGSSDGGCCCISPTWGPMADNVGGPAATAADSGVTAAAAAVFLVCPGVLPRRRFMLSGGGGDWPGGVFCQVSQ